MQIKNPGPEKKKTEQNQKKGTRTEWRGRGHPSLHAWQKNGGARGEGRAAGTSAIEVAGAQKPGAGRLEGKTGAALAWGALAWVTVAGSGME